MKFNVLGADERTGTELNLIVDGVSVEDVERQARRRGILVSRVTPRGGDEPRPVPLAYEPMPPIDAAASTAASLKARNVPEYAALKGIASVFKFIAVIYYLLAAACIVGLIVGISANTGSGLAATVGPWPIYVLFAFPAVGFIAAGVLFQGGAEVLTAFRDMAQNSFR